MGTNIYRNVGYSLSQSPLNELYPNAIIAERNPTTADKASLGQIWVNKVTPAVWILGAIVNNLANWVSINTSSATSTASLTITGPVPNFVINSMTVPGVLVNSAAGSVTSQALTNGQVLIGNTANPPVASTLTAGAGISILNGAGSITISAAGGSGLIWSSTASNAFTAAVNHGYRVTGTAPVVTLPATPALGDVVAVAQDSAAGTLVKILAGSGDVIYLDGAASGAGQGFISTSLANGGDADQVGVYMELLALSASAWTVRTRNGEFQAAS